MSIIRKNIIIIPVNPAPIFLFSGDSDDEDDLPTLKSVKMANHVNKNSRKREKFLENVKKAHRYVSRGGKRNEKVVIC